MAKSLFDEVALNAEITLQNRILMAPLTRCMADENLVPTEQMTTYYAKRAQSGLIISEATIIRADGQGYPNTPGLFTAEQIQGWQRVTKAVHNNGGKIFAQLWHTGRVAHPHFFNGNSVLAPSALKVEDTVPRMRELEYIEPTPVTVAQIEQLVKDYAQAASNAIDAGFDGVEIHGANGYLIDQFLHYNSNHRTDEFGGSPENMSRFALLVVDAISERIGAKRTALRISPGAYFNLEPHSDDRAVFDYLLDALSERELAYLHIGIFDDEQRFEYLGGRVSDYVRENYPHTLVGNGGFSAQSGELAINQGRFDLLAIGRPFIANPNYVERIKNGEELTPYNEEMLQELV